MKTLKTEVETLIARSFFLPPEDKKEILASNKEKQGSILPLLRKMDKDQTVYFRKVLKRNPNFFDELEGKMIEHQKTNIHA